ncbi:hypothetical protein BKA69DRAFT_1075875 [Paraphysoderma sedebokerense]|nr:hypothetical protein BKA69DRAFT_1075832 [Paraphysoderma sedebokerense]KAI9141270.1 hypothetical protein BKA69DRAFT_1075875 [Paraphysoderma sedebokerense]
MMSSTIGDKNLLQKRIPRNPRYEHIRSTLDTGSSLTNYLQKLQKKHNDYKVLGNEIFKRIKPLAFARLVLETSLEFDLDSHERTNMAFLSQYANNSRSTSDASTTRSPSVQSNMSMDSKSSRHYQHSDKATDNVSALMTDPPIQSKEQIHFQRQERQAIALRKRQQHSVPYNPELPYLLLDIRDSDSFVRCHIVGAMNFPAILIKRDQLTSEFIYFRNKPNKLIIVYDEDESIAGLAAQTLCERGIENVYLLSGGQFFYLVITRMKSALGLF